MSHLEPEELIHVRDLMENGKINEALKLVNVFEDKEDIAPQEQLSCYLLKSSILNKTEKIKESLIYTERAHKVNLKLGNNVQLFDIYYEMAFAYTTSMKIDELYDIVGKSENLLKNLENEAPREFKKRKADFALIKAMSYYLKGEYDKAIECAEFSLFLREELDIKVDIIFSFYYLALICFSMGELNLVLKWAEKCIELTENTDYKIPLHRCILLIGSVYHYKGELDNALGYYKRDLALTKERNDKTGIAYALNNIGMVYHQQGDFEQAQIFLENCLEAWPKFTDVPIGYVLDSCFHLALDRGDLTKAQHYLDRLKERSDQSSIEKIIYRVDEAVLLKTSPRALNRGKSEELLKQIIEEDIGQYEMLLTAILHLCDLLLVELRNTSSLEIIEELNSYINKLLNIADKNNSYLVMAETNLLRARLAQIMLSLKDARRFLTQAQEIAEKYGLSRLAMKISHEHDEFLKQLNTWESLEGTKVSIAERMKLARLSEQMRNMLSKRALELPEISEEDPVVLLVITEGGRPIFSQSFAKGWSFQDHLFGGFLTAVNSFSDEMFSEGLERAKFGEYTIIMKSVSPFLVCYLFKGQSYLAQQRIRYFIDSIQQDNTIWQTFNKYYQLNKQILSKDIPLLGPLVSEIFIEKTVQLIN